jgi:hypothetical protein
MGPASAQFLADFAVNTSGDEDPAARFGGQIH